MKAELVISYKPSELCKINGLDSLTELAKITGKSQRTLINWSKSQPALFYIVILGAAAYKSESEWY